MDRAIAVLALLAIAILVGRDAARRWALRRRALRAVRGERLAERILEGRGFAIEARQAAGEIVLEVDGRALAHPVRCDLLVRRRGRRFVAEVKTGSTAPRLDHAPTRRQLLEYLHAFDADAVLLVDAENDVVREIRLPGRRRSWWWLVSLVLVAALVTAWRAMP